LNILHQYLKFQLIIIMTTKTIAITTKQQQNNNNNNVPFLPGSEFEEGKQRKRKKTG